MNIVLLLLAFAGIGLIDLPGMIRDRRWRDLIIYSVIFLLVLALGMVIALGVKIPSTIKGIQSFYRDVLGLSFKPS